MVKVKKSGVKGIKTFKRFGKLAEQSKSNRA